MEGPFRRPLPDGLTLIETFGWRAGAASSGSPRTWRGSSGPRAALGVPFDRRGASTGRWRASAATRRCGCA